MPKARLDEARELLCPLSRQSGGMDGAFLRETIGRMQESIRSVAKALPQVAETIPSEGLELGELLCAQCSNRELCWGRARARTEKLMSSMMERSRQGEPIEEDALPALSQQGCLRAESIPEAAQEALSLHQQRLNRQKRARYERELTLTHLAAMLGSLSELNTVAAGESLNDLQAAHVIRQAMDELHVPAQLLYARRVDGHLQAALQAEAMFPHSEAAGGPSSSAGSGRAAAPFHLPGGKGTHRAGRTAAVQRLHRHGIGLRRAAGLQRRGRHLRRRQRGPALRRRAAAAHALRRHGARQGSP